MTRIDSNTLRHQFDALIAAFPEIAEDEVLRADMFEGETELHEYLRAIENMRRGAATYAAAIDIELDQLHARRDRFRRRDEAMRSLMLRILQWAELSKLELPEATISVSKGPTRVLIIDERAVPDRFCRIVRDPDRMKIREALNAFEDVPGASLSNAEPVLKVRVK